MKKFLKTFTFYFMLISLVTIFTHYTGSDSHGIVLFELNPVLSALRYTKFANSIMRNGPVIACGSLTGYISLYWYIAHFITFAAYGFIIDTIIRGYKRYCQQN